MKRIVIFLLAVLCEVSIFSQVEFETHLLDTAITGVAALYAADLNNDSHIDILAAYGSNIVWFKNSGAGTFTMHQVTSNSLNVDCLAGADIDGDGYMDFLSADDENFAWYENDGNEEFIYHSISSSVSWESYLFPVDINFDGRTDVVTVTGGRDKYSMATGEIVIYFNDGNKSFNSKTVAPVDATSIFARDFEGDGDIDLLMASVYDNRIAWYENVGSENFIAHMVSELGPGRIYSVDLNQDGYSDIIGKALGKLYWYKNDGAMNFEEIFIPNVDSLECPNDVFADEINGDGNIDLLTTGEKILWFENDGSENFNANIIADSLFNNLSLGHRIRVPIYTIDIDKDGDKDVISAYGLELTPAWYENKIDTISAYLATYPHKKFHLYPIPINSVLTIELESLSGGVIEIHNLNGQLIHRQFLLSTSEQIDMSEHPNGIYFVTVRSNDWVETGKVMKFQ